MANEEIFGHLLASKIDFTQSPWLAQYMYDRFPHAASTNESLPRNLVDKLCASGHYMPGYFRTHVLSPRQLRKMEYQRGDTVYWSQVFRYQRPSSPGDVLRLVQKDDTGILAGFALRYAEWSRVNQVSDAERRALREKADVDVRLYDVARNERLSDNDLRDIERWARDYEYDEYESKGADWLVERHFDQVLSLLDHDIPLLNSAFARSSHLNDVRHQRAVAHLDEGISTQGAPYWLEENFEVARYLVLNPVTKVTVLEEMRAVLDTVGRAISNDNFRRGGGAALVEGLLYRQIESGGYSLETAEYASIEDTKTLKWLLAGIVDSRSAVSNMARALALVGNPHLNSSQRARVQDCLVTTLSTQDNDDGYGYDDAPWPAARTRARRQAARLVEWGLAGFDFGQYWVRLNSEEVLPQSHSRYFLRELGEEKKLWDTFLSLSESWTGTIDELVETAKNLQ